MSLVKFALYARFHIQYRLSPLSFFFVFTMKVSDVASFFFKMMLLFLIFVSGFWMSRFDNSFYSEANACMEHGGPGTFQKSEVSAREDLRGPLNGLDRWWKREDHHDCADVVEHEI